MPARAAWPVMNTSSAVESMSVEASRFAALADETRLRILRRLAAGPRCVCDLRADVPVAANLLSYHLKVLRDAGLVTASRRGRWIDYALDHEGLQRLQAALPPPAPTAEGAGEARP
jgi:ArsR family transcriptional regulator, arsenate/arsenite/antimonite-responsive transcriptional repressor